MFRYYIKPAADIWAKYKKSPGYLIKMDLCSRETYITCLPEVFGKNAKYLVQKPNYLLLWIGKYSIFITNNGRFFSDQNIELMGPRAYTPNLATNTFLQFHNLKKNRYWKKTKYLGYICLCGPIKAKFK